MSLKLTNCIMHHTSVSFQHVKKSEIMYPMLRVAAAREMAQVFIFLASDQSKFITGALVPVDGGISIMSQHAMETNFKIDLTESMTPTE